MSAVYGSHPLIRASRFQQRVLGFTPSTTAYHAQVVVRISGPCDPNWIERKLSAVIERSEALRTELVQIEGLRSAVQEIRAPRPMEFRLVEPQENWDLALDRLCDIETEALASSGPHLRTAFLAGEARGALVLTCSSLIADAHSLCEIAGRLTREPGGEELQYMQVSEWDHGLPTEVDGASFEPLASTARFRAGSPAASGLEPRRIAIRHPGLAALSAAAMRDESTTAALLLSSWAAVLARSSDAPDLTVAVLCSGRTEADLEPVVGLLARYVPVNLSTNLTPGERLAEAERALQEAQDWQHFRRLDRLPLELSGALAGFDLIEVPLRILPDGATLTIARATASVDRLAARLACTISESLDLHLAFDAAQVPPEAATLLGERLEAELEAAVRRCPTAVLTARERAVQDALLPTPGHRVDWCPIQQRIAEIAATTPDAVALVDAAGALSYAAMERASERLAGMLADRGIGRGALAAVVLPRSSEAVVAALAILKTGAAFVVLDPMQAPPRLRRMLDEARPAVVITRGETGVLTPADPVLRLDLPPPIVSAAPVLELHPLDLAYVVFTSGSTGGPKGVAVSHDNLAHYVIALAERTRLPEGASFGLVSGLDADIGYSVLFLALSSGGIVHVLSRAQIGDADAVADYFRRCPVDCVKMTPSQFDALDASVGTDKILPRRLLILGGEGRPAGWIAKLAAKSPGVRVMNHYGPTETTVGVLTGEVSLDLTPDQRQLPLTTPLSGCGISLLDPDLAPVPVWAQGELYLSGPQLARGYLGRPAETAERFLPNPFSEHAGARMYRTGDIGRLTASGGIELDDRRDLQLKLRGFRIEPGEIENVIVAHSQVKQVAVVARQGPQDTACLVAFVVPQRQAAAAIAGRRRHVLPNGMAMVFQNRNELDYVYAEIFEHLTYFRHGITLADDAVVLDIGANIGMFTAFVGQHARHSRVFAFEPISETAELLQINAELYGGRAKVYQQGVSDHVGEEVFEYYPRHTMMSGLSAYAAPEEEARVVRRYLDNASATSAKERALAEMADEILDGHFESRQQRCRVTTVSAMLRDERLDAVDLLKIDVQRAELEVLTGIDDADWPRIRQIAMELHDPEGKIGKGRLGLICAMLEARGFRTFAEQNDLLQGTDRWSLYATRTEAKTQHFPVLGLPPQVLTAEQVQRHLAEHLPEFMRPSEVVILPQLPVTSSNKLDRRALEIMDIEAMRREREYITPRTAAERTVAAIWAEVLQVDRVSTDDNFFDLGGHSLLVMMVASRLRERLKVKLPIRAFFDWPTVGGLAAAAVRELAGSGPEWAEPKIRRMDDLATQLRAAEQASS